MIYTVECELATPERVSEWDVWYMSHLHTLLSVPGIRTAQRFRCTTPWPSAYLAAYSIDSAEVMESEPYRQRGGRKAAGVWQPVMIHWHRNVFDGIGIVPPVAKDELMLLTEATPAEVAGAGVEFAWLQNIGLDRTIGPRGIAFAEATRGESIAAASSGRIRAYRPLTERLVSPHGLA